MEETKEILIDVKPLKAAVDFVDKNYTRPVLTTVSLRVDEKLGGYEIAATDSYTLFTCKCGAVGENTSNYLLDGESLKIIKSTDSKLQIEDYKELSGDRFELTVKIYDKKNIARTAILTGLDAGHYKYPNYRQLLVSDADLGAGTEIINADYLAKVCKAAKTVYGKNPHIETLYKQDIVHSPVFFKLSDSVGDVRGLDCTALIMPVKK